MRDNYKKVKRILETHEDARNDDNVLRAILWLQEGLIDKEEYYFLRGLSHRTKGYSIEGISRARRKVQEDNPQLCNNKTKAVRLLEEEEYRNYYGKKDIQNG